MPFTSWRGVVGVIKPTYRPGSLEEFIRLLPDGIGVIPLFLGISRGTQDEFRDAIKPYEEKVRQLAEMGVDLVHPEGAPPFQLLGYDGEHDVVERWQQLFEVRIVTAPQTQVEAMRALDIRRFVGVTYFEGVQNEIATAYFQGAGFDVLAMEGMSVPFEDVGQISYETVYALARRAFLKHPNADGIYMLGSGWRSLDAVQLLEEDLGVPVVHPVPARVWAVQRRLHVNQPIDGYGQLLDEMP